MHSLSLLHNLPQFSKAKKAWFSLVADSREPLPVVVEGENYFRYTKDFTHQ